MPAAVMGWAGTRCNSRGVSAAPCKPLGAAVRPARGPEIVLKMWSSPGRWPCPAPPTRDPLSSYQLCRRAAAAHSRRCCVTSRSSPPSAASMAPPARCTAPQVAWQGQGKPLLLPGCLGGGCPPRCSSAARHLPLVTSPCSLLSDRSRGPPGRVPRHHRAAEAAVRGGRCGGGPAGRRRRRRCSLQVAPPAGHGAEPAQPQVADAADGGVRARARSSGSLPAAGGGRPAGSRLCPLAHVPALCRGGRPRRLPAPAVLRHSNGAQRRRRAPAARRHRQRRAGGRPVGTLLLLLLLVVGAPPGSPACWDAPNGPPCLCQLPAITHCWHPLCSIACRSRPAASSTSARLAA